MSRFYVYLFLRTDGTPYYVGKGTGRRQWHRNRRVKPPTDLARNIRILDGMSEEDAHAWEVLLIAHWGRKDNGTGILRNLTDGGEGNANPAAEVRHKIGTARRGVTFAAETKEKLRQANLGKKHSPDTIAKMVESRRGRKHPPRSDAWREKQSAARAGRTLGPYTDEHKQSISAGKAAKGAASLGLTIDEYMAMSPHTRMKLRQSLGLPPLRKKKAPA